MTELRIMQIIKGLDIGGLNGGAERFSIDLAEQLRNQGCKVDLCVFFRMNTPAETNWLNMICDQGADVFFATDWAGSNNFRSVFTGSKALRSYIQNKGYDILHSHFQQGTYTALWLKRKCNIPVVLRTAHNVVEWEPGLSGKVKEALSDIVFPRCLDMEVGVSSAIVEKLSKRYSAHNRIHRPVLIYNGINLNLVDMSLSVSDTPASTKGEFTIGAVGRLTEQKGYTYLLAAMPSVLNRHPHTKLVLLGDGELRADLESQSRKLGIESQVEFAGQVNNVMERFQGFDLFVSSSLWEGLPTVIMEAMAADLPVVATTIPGTKEMIKDGENGKLIPPKNPLALAAAINEMIENPKLRGELRDAGRRSVGQYSIEEIAKQYIQLYETLLMNSRG